MKGKNLEESMKILCSIQSPYLGLLAPTSAPESNLNRSVALFFFKSKVGLREEWCRNIPSKQCWLYKRMTFMEEETFELSPLGE